MRHCSSATHAAPPARSAAAGLPRFLHKMSALHRTLHYPPAQGQPRAPPRARSGPPSGLRSGGGRRRRVAGPSPRAGGARHHFIMHRAAQAARQSAWLRGAVGGAPRRARGPHRTASPASRRRLQIAITCLALGARPQKRWRACSPSGALLVQKVTAYCPSVPHASCGAVDAPT